MSGVGVYTIGYKHWYKVDSVASTEAEGEANNTSHTQDDAEIQGILGRRYANGHYQIVKVPVVICEPTQILDPVDGRCCDVLTFLLFRSGHPRHPLTQGLGQHLRQRVHITQDDVVFERECVQVPLHLDLHFPVHLLVCDTLHIQDR